MLYIVQNATIFDTTKNTSTTQVKQIYCTLYVQIIAMTLECAYGMSEQIYAQLDKIDIELF